MKKYKVALTDAELLILDGVCEAETQSIVNEAKRRAALVGKVSLTESQVAFVVAVRSEAEQNGRLIFRYNNVRGCELCNRKAGYVKYARNSRYHRRGEPNYDRPLSIRGIELADRCVRMKGYSTLGCCVECWKALQPQVAEHLDGVIAELPKQVTGIEPEWKRVAIRKCKKCEWEGLETDMGTDITLMGDGRYPSTCPKCKAKNAGFGPTVVERLDQHKVVRCEPSSAT